MGIPAKLPDAREMIERCLKVQLVPFLRGSPACGKSSLFHQIAEDYNLKMVDVRLAASEPPDLNGYPDIYKDKTKAGYLPMDTFPVEGDELPTNPKTGKKYSGWLILLDELPLADVDVLKAVYKLLLDKQVGQYQLHPKVAIAAAGNLVSDNAMVADLDNTALASRMIHMEMMIDHVSWLIWARANNIDHRITSYISWKPDMLFKFDPESNDETFAAPRTWEFTSRLIKDMPTLGNLDKIILSGTISEGVAREFVAFCAMEKDLPNLNEILNSPNTVSVPKEPSVLFMLTGWLGHNATVDNIGPLMQYVSRIAKEFQMIAMKEIFQRTPKIKKTSAVEEWVLNNAHELY